MTRTTVPVVLIRLTDANEAELLETVSARLGTGEPVVLPTDTVYGLAVPCHDRRAVRRLFEVKQRPGDTAIAVLVADTGALEHLAGDVPEQAARLAERFWPGALTLVLPARSDPGEEPSTAHLGGHAGAVGVRCPNSAFVRKVASRVGPLATTSANLHGRPTPTSAAEVVAALNDPALLVVDGGTLEGEPSTVVDFTEDPPKMLREAALSAGELGLA